MKFRSFALLAAVTVGTWNGQRFPSGRAEHRAKPEVEAKTIADAGRMLREGIRKVDPAGTNDLILCFNEIRGPEAAEALCRAVGRTNLAVAIVSAYRRRDRFDMQQDVLATTLPVVSANWSRWKLAKQVDETPPRGYAHALVVMPGAVTTAVYAVHFKSNYGQTTAAEAKANRAKRSNAARQLVRQEGAKRGRRPHPVIVAGDFNADAWADDAGRETIFTDFSEAGFENILEKTGPEGRITNPGRGKWRGKTLDYIMTRSLRTVSAPVVVPAGPISDHSAVFANIVP